MKKILLNTLFSLLLTFEANAVTYIQAQETMNRFLKVKEVASGEYSFEVCEQKNKKLICKPLLEDQKTFRRFQIRELVEMNERHMAYAATADVAIVAASLFFGWILAAKATAAYYIGAGVSLDGGVAAVGGALYGTPSGIAASSTIIIALDELDPFVHRDLSIALEHSLDEADPDDLEDVEARKYEDGVLVVIEDISFNQLVDKIKSQLRSLD